MHLEEYLNDASCYGEFGKLHCTKHFNLLIEQLLNIAH